VSIETATQILAAAAAVTRRGIIRANFIADETRQPTKQL
jgi:hypothetical protein